MGKATRSKSKLTQEDMDMLAWDVAMDNHENNFPSRRGIGSYTDLPLLYVYDNNPSRELAIPLASFAALPWRYCPGGSPVTES